LKSRVVIGTEVYSSNWGVHFSPDDVRQIIEKGLHHNVTDIDTAASYGDNHFVEELLGDAIQDLRSQVKLHSKFGINQCGSGKGGPISSISEIERSLATTLASLKTDFLDIYYFHSGSDEAFFQDDIWAWLNDMVKLGVIRQLGLSINHGIVKSGSTRQLIAAKDYGISVVQTVLNLYSRESLNFLIPFCRKENINIYGRMPLGKGLLTGKYDINSKFEKSDPRGKDLKTTNDILKFVEDGIFDINAENAIKWALQHVDKVVVGTKSKTQLSEIIKYAS
jgi:aryl-alcohol dehydrogenase-like predicted oxidoreductase